MEPPASSRQLERRDMKDGLARNRDAIRRLMALSLDDSETMFVKLSRICMAVRPLQGAHDELWWSQRQCEALRDCLIEMLEGTDESRYVRRLHDAAENHEDITVMGVDYMAYPTDANGVQVHLDDTVEAPGGTRFKVRHLSLRRGSWIAEDENRETLCPVDRCVLDRGQTVVEMLDEYYGLREGLGHPDDCIDDDEAAHLNAALDALSEEYASKIVNVISVEQ